MHIELKNIVTLPLETQLKIRDFQNSPIVKQYTLSENYFTEERFNALLKSLGDKTKEQAFIIFNDDEIAGWATVYNIETDNTTAYTSLYLYDDKVKTSSHLTKILYKLLDYSFGVLGMDKINCDALITNTLIINLYKKFGFVQEGIRRSNVSKNGKRLDVVLLGFTKEEWIKSKTKLDYLLKMI